MIYTLTLNPAIDRILFLDELKVDRTNRIRRAVDTLGGKGTHVSINLSLLGVPSTALGVTFGKDGERIAAMMREWRGVDTRFLHYEQDGLNSRTNYLLIEEAEHHCTMVTEKGPLPSAVVTGQLMDQIAALLRPDDFLVLTGDASNVEDTDIYTKLSTLAVERGARVVLDASGPYLRQGLAAHPFLIKPNQEELSYLAGRELANEADILEAMTALDPFGIEWIVMTWGDKGAVARIDGHLYRVHPVVSRLINETGCGDAFLAALLAGIIASTPILSILKAAAATAAAAAELDTTTGFDPARVEELKNQAIVDFLG